VLTKASFDYAVLRVVPRMERQEFLNIGVIVFCLEKRLLEIDCCLRHLDNESQSPGRRGTAANIVADARPRNCEAARGRGGTHLRGRRDSRPGRQALAERTLPVADRAAQHNHPDVGGAYGDSYGRRFARG
jgi:hypothetical protein